ncbi:hypothetical protein [Comamonas sp. GB3 AK4-5]|uniref:hypothetical protein n=1 Tax=Comamonas sp. GB3 AK4-5 TaxID=3231487 RepID=UPI00351E2D78
MTNKTFVSQLSAANAPVASVVKLFLEDDGTLPDICFKRLSMAEVSAVYELLRGFAQDFESSPYWSVSDQADRRVLATESASEVLAQAEAKFFHIVLLGVKSPSGLSVPALGVCVLEDQISIDYRAGHEWGMGCVHGLFEIVCAALQLCATPVVAHEGNCNDPDGALLRRALDGFKKAGSRTDSNPAG